MSGDYDRMFSAQLRLRRALARYLHDRQLKMANWRIGRSEVELTRRLTRAGALLRLMCAHRSLTVGALAVFDLIDFRWLRRTSQDQALAT
jgi:hypothetical protein